MNDIPDPQKDSSAEGKKPEVKAISGKNKFFLFLSGLGLICIIVFFCLYCSPTTIEGTVTYLPPGATEPKPDVGARVYVLQGDALKSHDYDDCFYVQTRKQGEVGKDGKFVLKNVAGGNYVLLIVSQHVKRDYINDDKKTHEEARLFLTYDEKFYVTNISLHWGKPLIVNHDFGRTYFTPHK